MERRGNRVESVANILWNPDRSVGDIIGSAILFWLFLALSFALSSPWRWFFAAWCIWFILGPLIASLMHGIVFIMRIWEIFTKN